MESRLRSRSPGRLALLAAAALLCGACSHPPARAPHATPAPDTAERRSVGRDAARIAQSQVGAPYRYGGRTPEGFDCSGLVHYSFARAGLSGLPRSAAELAELARPVAIDSLEVGDLLFFSFSPREREKKSHVGIYLGDRRFVHAPSSGKAVEIVSFDHVYWGPRIEDAGRIAH